MLDEYILRRDALNEFHEWIVSNDGNIFSLADALEAIPAAHVAEVVYCSECVYHYDGGDNKCKKLRIPCPDDSEFFCKYGKKKRGE